MAKVKGIFSGNLQGRVGNVVFRNRNGQNIASQRAASVKNPRTEAQQIQRASFATVVGAYSVLKEICDHSFENVSYGEKSQAHFLKINSFKGTNDGDTANLMARGASYVAQRPFIVSQGSLPSPVFSVTFGAPNGYPNIDINIAGFTAQTLTLGVFCEKFGVSKGQQITIGAVLAERSDLVSMNVGVEYNLPIKCKLALTRFVLNPNLPDDYLIFGNGKSFADAVIESENLSNYEVEPNTWGDGHFLFNGDYIGSNVCFGCFVIISDKQNGKWLRSTSSFIPLGSDFIVDEGILDYGLPLNDQVVAQYSPSANAYLNNAEN